MHGFRSAFALSKQAVRDAKPPGTVVLIDRSYTNSEGEIKLVPEPSLDPADPLNWPMYRKVAILTAMSFYAFLGNFTSASLSSALPIYATPAAFNPPIPFSKLSYLVAVNVLMMGAANFWNVPLANTFGRRPVVLFHLLLLVFSSMWAGLAKSFDSLLAARIFMGIGVSVSETVAPDTVGEVFFVHQRGRAMAFYTVFLASGSLVGGTVGSYIVASGGLGWLHWTNVILAAVALVVCFFFQPETLFDRDTAIQRARGFIEDSDEKSEVRRESVVDKQDTHRDFLAGADVQFEPYTFLRSLKMGTYRPGLLRRLIGPILVLRFPGVWLVMLWYAGLVGGIVTISTVAPTMMASPPYLWGANAGLSMVGGIIGTIVGALYTALLVDRSLQRQAKKAINGFAEPESRLKIALPGLFLATTGLWTFGFCAANPGGARWVGMQVGLGMLAFGLMQAPSVGFNYIMDSYHAVSGDSFVAVVGMRAIVAFAWTFFVNKWVEGSGAAEPFGVFGALMGVFSLLTFVIMFYGKRFRIATEKWLPAEESH